MPGKSPLSATILLLLSLITLVWPPSAAAQGNANWAERFHPPGVKKSDFRRTPRLEIFRQQGIILTHVTQTISAEAAINCSSGAHGSRRWSTR